MWCLCLKSFSSIVNVQYLQHSAHFFYAGRQARSVGYLTNSSPSCCLVFCLLCPLPNPENGSPIPAPEGRLLPHYKVQDMSGNWIVVKNIIYLAVNCWCSVSATVLHGLSSRTYLVTTSHSNFVRISLWPAINTADRNSLSSLRCLLRYWHQTFRRSQLSPSLRWSDCHMGLADNPHYPSCNS